MDYEVDENNKANIKVIGVGGASGKPTRLRCIR